MQRDLVVATAESCTGGGIASAVTDVAGSSAWFDRGYVTYSNASKMDLLGVKAETLENKGAVSRLVAIEMAEGCLRNSSADIAVSVTGIAGPSGETTEKPLGTVFIALATEGQKTICRQYHFNGDRNQVRQQTIMTALQLMQQ